MTTTSCMATVSGPLRRHARARGRRLQRRLAAPGGLTERDRTPVVERAIDGAPGMSLVFTRARDDGGRQVDVQIAATAYPFHTDGGRRMLDANGPGFGARAAVCGMATPDVHGGTDLSIRCAIADASGLGPLRAIETPTSAWLGDVCTDGDHVTLLSAVGPPAIDPDAPAGRRVRARARRAAVARPAARACGRAGCGSARGCAGSLCGPRPRPA